MHFDDTWLTWALLCSIAIFAILIFSVSLLLFFASKDKAEARLNRKSTQLALADTEREFHRLSQELREKIEIADLRCKLNGHCTFIPRS